MSVSLILWIVLVIAEAFFHAAMFKRGIKPNYIQWTVIRGIVAILHGIFADVIQKRWSLNAMNDYLPLFIFQVASHYLVFDYTLNKRRKLPWDYRGKSSGIFFDNLPLPVYYGLKVLCVGGFIYSTAMLL
jgi:hypothetical protein